MNNLSETVHALRREYHLLKDNKELAKEKAMPGAAYFIAGSDNMLFAVRVFINLANEMCFSIYAQNDSYVNQKFYISTYLNPFLCHEVMDNAECRWFREVKVFNPLQKSKQGLCSFEIKVNEDISRTESISNYGILKRSIRFDKGGCLISHEETASRYQYVGGSRSSLHNAESLKKGTFGAPQRHICAV